uniref:Uncharacterized protein n=1 Tax=Glossina austeni TaxID=7395 RepID=A0A1A9V4Z5_GLOAU
MYNSSSQREKTLPFSPLRPLVNSSELQKRSNVLIGYHLVSTLRIRPTKLNDKWCHIYMLRRLGCGGGFSLEVLLSKGNTDDGIVNRKRSKSVHPTSPTVDMRKSFLSVINPSFSILEAWWCVDARALYKNETEHELSTREEFLHTLQNYRILSQCNQSRLLSIESSVKRLSISHLTFSGSVSEPAGFTCAVAIIVSMSQIKRIFVVRSEGSSFLQRKISLLNEIGYTNGYRHEVAVHTALCGQEKDIARDHASDDEIYEN